MACSHWRNRDSSLRLEPQTLSTLRRPGLGRSCHDESNRPARHHFSAFLTPGMELDSEACGYRPQAPGPPVVTVTRVPQWAGIRGPEYRALRVHHDHDATCTDFRVDSEASESASYPDPSQRLRPPAANLKRMQKSAAVRDSLRPPRAGSPRPPRVGSPP
jgi:hypothetical protein